MTPALLTSTSRRPNSSLIHLNVSNSCDSSVTSHFRATILPPEPFEISGFNACETKEWSLIRNYCVNRKCKTTKSMEPKIWSTSWQRNASKIVKLLNWWYRKICTHFNGIDTSTQPNHNHASVGQCFCYVCPDPSTWARHHRHFSMPFIHFRSACFWFRFTMHLLGRTEHVNRNGCFCGFSWRCVAACFARNDLIAKLFIHLDVWEKTKHCECLVDVFYTGVDIEWAKT